MSNVVQQCKKLGITIGDTIQGREEYGDGWNEARLTLLWLGAETAVWSVATRNDRQPRWQQQGEESNWTLDCRDWRKVQPNNQVERQPQVVRSDAELGCNACEELT